MDAPAEVTFAPLLLGGIGLMVLAAGALVLFVVTYQKRLLEQQLRLRGAETVHQQELLTAIIAAQETERERIGRDLHDDVASSIAMAKMLVDRFATSPAADDTAALLTLAREVLSNAVEEVRSVSHNLYPAVLARVGLAKALEQLADRCHRSAPLAVVLDINYPRPLLLAQELALYRIGQELVYNTLKHAAGATQVSIRLQEQAGILTLSVADNGCGFAVDEVSANKAGVGLRSIGVRVQMLQAHLHQQSALGQGTCTRIELVLTSRPA